MISVIITSHNESTDLEVTATLAACGSVRPCEVIVVDDCSDEKYAVGDRLDKIERVRVIKTPRQLGVAASRNYGAGVAKGDIIVFLDSHMRMPDWWLEAIIEAVNRNPSAVMCAACTAFDYLNGSEFFGSGATFDPNAVGLEPSWLDADFNGPTSVCPCIIGACYIIPRPVWRSLRGFNTNFIGWGQDEQDLSIRAWMFGFEVRRISRLVVSHRWDRTPIMDSDARIKESWQKCLTEAERIRRLPTGNFMNHWHPGYNSVVNCATVFEDGIFGAYQRVLRDKYPDSRVWRLFYENETQINEYRNWVQGRRVRTDAEVENIVGYCIPRPKVEQ